ncbi:carbohydrate ABC transporter permease [Halomarina pelagica]|uniref:carbohydrate ABC transporter permease n=1 Tax=Halomarina pelagica TaxID=2961599 RepID=UPI0020C48CAE|nr:sugar ABC transporter permease [Halomarina sp. BND7]
MASDPSTSTGLRGVGWRAADALRYRRQALARRLPSFPGVPYLFLAPFFVLFAVFLAFPIAYTVYLSFFEFQGVGEGALLWIDFGPVFVQLPRMADLRFVGLANYARLLEDAQFHNALSNTVFILAVQVPLMIGVALGLALALNASFVRAKGLFRTAIALPVSANLVAYATVFLLLLQEHGLVNYLLTGVGLPAVPWLSSPFWSRLSIVGAVTWRWTGYNMIILLAGLQTVPEQLYEAAEIDGANRWEKFRYVTLPQLRPVLLFVLVTSTIGTFRLFSEPLIIDEGGAPTEATRTVVVYIYRMAFKQFELGYASAMTVVLVAIVSVLSIVQLKAGGEDDA